MVSNQKDMGAYYTGEDISTYISKNALIPFLFDTVAQKCPDAFAPAAPIWTLLREQPDRYLYAALCKGCELPLPSAIEAGVHDIGKRVVWDQPAPEEYALPLETWREVVTRRQHYMEIKRRMSLGEIHAIDDLVTYNLDISRFACDTLAHCAEADLLLAWYESLASVTVLDPTCGTGAFLIAILSILESLYKACLAQMQRMLTDRSGSGEMSVIAPCDPAPLERFRAILSEVEQYPDQRHWIDQAIIAHNLYGVDILPEVTAHCRRLLLAACDPEIAGEMTDALTNHIRTGNALVGRVTGEQRPGEDRGACAPFHWCIEFSEIMQRGGFDVIIGNPPYVAYSKVKEHYQIQGYETQTCGNLYAYTLERALSLLRTGGRCGMIVPVSAIASMHYQPLMKLVAARRLWISSYSNRPARLFAGVEQRLAILLMYNVPQPALFTSAYRHWYEQERVHLFDTLIYTPASRWPPTGMPLKTGTAQAEVICARLFQRHGFPLLSAPSEDAAVWAHNGPTYWVRVLPFEPNVGHQSQRSRHYARIPVSSQDVALALTAILSSSTFYFFYITISNCRDLGRKELCQFPLGQLQPKLAARLTHLGRALAERLRATATLCTRQYPSGLIEYEVYHPARAKTLLDEIDCILAEHYGFTDEELNFIINYELKYRMGKEGYSSF